MRARKSAGFSLVEVLIAVSVFAILAGSVYLTLSALSEAAFVQRERGEELAELQLGVARLEADLRQLVSRPVRVADGGHMPALAGRGDRLEATRAGWDNSQAQRRSQLQRFGWQVTDGGLLRQSWPVTDRTGGEGLREERVVEGIEALSVEYRAADGAWLEQWPPEADVGQLPAAVRYRLQSQRFGQIERVIVL